MTPRKSLAGCDMWSSVQSIGKIPILTELTLGKRVIVRSRQDKDPYERACFKTVKDLTES